MFDVVWTLQEDRIAYRKNFVDAWLDPIVGPNFFDSAFFNSQYVHAVIVFIEQIESWFLKGQIFDVPFELKTGFWFYSVAFKHVVFYYM